MMYCVLSLSKLFLCLELVHLSRTGNRPDMTERERERERERENERERERERLAPVHKTFFHQCDCHIIYL